MDLARLEADAIRHAPPQANLYAFAALVALTALTYALSFVHLGAWSAALALGIATAKGSLVALVFMHLRHQRGASRLVLVTAVLFVAVLIALTVTDVETRAPFELPRPARTAPR
jgi:cytochrome c oxidase subunit 4